jgi:NHLM bacteriocin system ABC transporter ATP-binding protein
MAAHSSALLSADADAFETRTTFSLSDSTATWFVRSGVLEVFAVSAANRNAPGALRALFSVTAGQAAFGVPAAVDVTLVARRSRETEVVRCPFGDVRGVEPFASGPDDHVALLADWIAALSRAAAGDLVPKNLGWLEQGAQLTIEDTARPLSSKPSLVWVRQHAGQSRFLGRAEAVIKDGPALFPVSRHAWIEAAPNSALSVVDSVPALDEREVRDGLVAFYSTVFACIAANLKKVDERERQRFRSRADADARAVRAALRDLASPLRHDADRAVVATGAESFDTPLMRACRVIGRALGVTMIPHPDMVRGRPIRNPAMSIAQASGLRYRVVALKERWLTRSSEPLLAFRDEDRRPVALLPRGARRGYLMYEPDTETMTPLDAREAATLNPFAFMFYRPFSRTALTLRDLLAFSFGECRRELLLIVAVSVATGGLALLTPYVTGVVFDSIIPNGQRRELVTVAALLVVAALVTGLFNLARGFAVLRLQGKLSLSLQAALWDRLLSLPLPFFRQYAAGDLAQRSIAFTQMRTLLSGPTLSALLSGVFSVFSFGQLFYISPRLAVIATLLTVIAVAVTLTAGLRQLRLGRRMSEIAGRISGMVVEFIGGIAKLRIAGAEQRAFVLWVRQFASQKREDFKVRGVGTWLAVFNSIYIVMCTAVLFFANSGVEGWRDDTLSTGGFLAFMAAFNQFTASGLGMGAAVVGVSNAIPLYERARPILSTLPESTVAQAQPGELSGEVEAHHLVFRYNPDAPLVLRDVSFHIRQGEYVAFVGPSGCGKSTVFRLLLGFETPVSGAIYYGGADLAGLDAQAVRRQIGVVLQTGTLLAGSLKENICGASWLPEDAVWEAARLAGLDEDIRNMPMGLHTVVQAGGGGLSGGQRQRVLIARAIANQPRLLLFDEATSALDNRTQAIVSESLKRLNATRIVIAHRLSTIVDADRIFVMNHGQIIQTGTYAELMAEPGLFRELAERQLL